MFHSQDFDLELCNEIQLETEETSAPRWFAFVVGSVASFYLVTTLLVIVRLA